MVIPDVSFWQDDPTTPLGIDFAKMKQKTNSVIIRAGQNLWVDNEFVISWKAAKEAGLWRGSYWFYDSRADPKRQAQLWISILGDDKGELPLWCDFEDQYNGAFAGWKHWFNFIEEAKRLAPNKQIGIYTGYYYWLEKTASAPIASKDYFRQYPLWIARYSATEPLIPYPWKDWTLWQYTDNGDGTPYGVESKNIDLNYYNGDEVKFKQQFSLSNLPDSPPNEEQENNIMARYSMTPIDNGTRLREDHNTFSKVITSYNRGQLVLGDEVWVAPADGAEVKKGDIWLKVLSVDGTNVPVRGWMAHIHKGQFICENFKEVIVAPPPPPVADVELSFTSERIITLLNNNVPIPGEYTGTITIVTKA